MEIINLCFFVSPGTSVSEFRPCAVFSRVGGSFSSQNGRDCDLSVILGSDQVRWSDIVLVSRSDVTHCHDASVFCLLPRQLNSDCTWNVLTFLQGVCAISVMMDANVADANRSHNMLPLTSHENWQWMQFCVCATYPLQ